jgi:transcriptional regulator with XRE-family HTH domain
LTQAELAARVGTSQPVVSAYEHDRRDPSVPTLRRLLAGTGVRLELRTSSLMVGADDAERIGSTDRERAARLVDVLLLADAIPARPRRRDTFPRITSR